MRNGTLPKGVESLQKAIAEGIPAKKRPRAGIRHGEDGPEARKSVGEDDEQMAGATRPFVKGLPLR